MSKHPFKLLWGFARLYTAAFDSWRRTRISVMLTHIIDGAILGQFDQPETRELAV